MPKVDVLHPEGNDFDPFLFASVGEDLNGTPVTVVSALARLGLDPWKEAAELVVLGREAARARLETLLSGLKDVPALDLESGAVAARLSLLLPKRLSDHASKLAASTTTKLPQISIGWSIAVLFLIAALVRIYFLAQSG